MRREAGDNTWCTTVTTSAAAQFSSPTPSLAYIDIHREKGGAHWHTRRDPVAATHTSTCSPLRGGVAWNGETSCMAITVASLTCVF